MKIEFIFIKKDGINLPLFFLWKMFGYFIKESKEQDAIYESQHRSLEQYQRELNNLVDMRCKDLINDELFKSRKDSLERLISDLRDNVNLTEDKADHWIELCEILLSL